MRIYLDDHTVKICYPCYNIIAREQKISNPAFYKGKQIVITSDIECDLCNLKNDIKIDPETDNNLKRDLDAESIDN